MYLSKFRQRLLLFLNSKREYIVNVKVTVAEMNGFFFIDKKVIARNKTEAKKLAATLAKADISCQAVGCKSLGKTHDFIQQ